MKDESLFSTRTFSFRLSPSSLLFPNIAEYPDTVQLHHFSYRYYYYYGPLSIWRDGRARSCNGV